RRRPHLIRGFRRSTQAIATWSLTAARLRGTWRDLGRCGGDFMSQRNVERLMGRLLTDEDLREQFVESPERAVERFVAEGWELTDDERAAFAGLERRPLVELARHVDPRIRKVSFSPNRSTAASTHPSPVPDPAAPRPNGDLGKEAS